MSADWSVDFVVSFVFCSSHFYRTLATIRSLQFEWNKSQISISSALILEQHLSANFNRTECLLKLPGEFSAKFVQALTSPHAILSQIRTSLQAFCGWSVSYASTAVEMQVEDEHALSVRPGKVRGFKDRKLKTWMDNNVRISYVNSHNAESLEMTAKSILNISHITVAKK